MNDMPSALKESVPQKKHYIKMLFEQRVLGAIFLIVGTAMGGGILALPVSNASAGFVISTGYLLVSWFVMTFCAFLLLEISLQFPVGTNFLTISKNIFGKWGQGITGFVYLFLLYTLLAAYMAGSRDVIHALGKNLGWTISSELSSLLFVLIFGLIVFRGLRVLDYANRIMVILKFVLYFSIVGLSVKWVELSRLSAMDWQFSPRLMMVLFTAFGFAVVIPSLREYLEDDRTKLRITVLIGSLVPLFIYLLWNFVLMGTIGTEQLLLLVDSEESTTQMILQLSSLLQKNYLSTVFYGFSAICLVTSFFGIALSLSDFLADGLRLKKVGFQNIGLFILTFLPPWLCVIFFAKGYVTALSYAGIFCLLLHVVIPIFMGQGIVKTHPQLKRHFAFKRWINFVILILSAFIISSDFLAW